jgi:23S rRNA pseudouridine2605 synthase
MIIEAIWVEFMTVDKKPGTADAGPMRIARRIARAGICSRRDAERLIAQGRVSVDGRVVATPALDVGEQARIEVDGKPLAAPQPVRLWRYHKPKGQVSTSRDPQGRPTIFDTLPADLPRLMSIGRLDINTEGLLLLTNDGELARHLELPATGWLRRYRVRARGRVAPQGLDAIRDGVEIDGVRYGPVEARIDSTQGANMWLSIGLREGKNREVRRLMEHLGLVVNRLIRVSFGPFSLGDLTLGQVEEVRRRVLADQLGAVHAARFGLGGGSATQARPRAMPQRPPRTPARAGRPATARPGTRPDRVSSARPPARPPRPPRKNRP